MNKVVQDPSSHPPREVNGLLFLDDLLHEERLQAEAIVARFEACFLRIMDARDRVPVDQHKLAAVLRLLEERGELFVESSELAFEGHGMPASSLRANRPRQAPIVAWYRLTSSLELGSNC